jgi:hypothetical protein
MLLLVFLVLQWLVPTAVSLYTSSNCGGRSQFNLTTSTTITKTQNWHMFDLRCNYLVNFTISDGNLAWYRMNGTAPVLLWSTRSSFYAPTYAPTTGPYQFIINGGSPTVEPEFKIVDSASNTAFTDLADSVTTPVHYLAAPGPYSTPVTLRVTSKGLFEFATEKERQLWRVAREALTYGFTLRDLMMGQSKTQTSYPRTSNFDFPTGNSDSPMKFPTTFPTTFPTSNSDSPMKFPTTFPTHSSSPTNFPTKDPTNKPTKPTTQKPTNKPTKQPTNKPTNKPTKNPTNKPTKLPTNKPTNKPTKLPTNKPTNKPTKQPTNKPTKQPTKQPTNKPTKQPT